MKGKTKFWGIIAVGAIMVILSGCASLFYSVRIRTDGDISSVLRGGSITCRSSGRELVWSVSSTPSEGGPVASGTYITQNGLLTVSPSESAPTLYVLCRSNQDDYSDIKQIRIVTVTSITINPQNQPVIAGGTLRMTAQVSGTNNPDQNVRWNVSGNGTISSSGVLSVSDTAPVGTISVTATSLIDPSRSSTISVRVIKVVDAKYRFSGGNWIILGANSVAAGASSALGETTFTVNGGGVNISYTGVYTEGGGTQSDGSSWAYLYDSSGKIGIVVAGRSGNANLTIVALGRTQADNLNANRVFDTNGMQNTHNGMTLR